VVNSAVLSPQNQTIRNLKATKPNSDLLQLLIEVIPEKSALVFCSTKKGCEQTAEALAKDVPKDFLAVRRQEKLQLLENLRIASGSTTIFSPSLQSTIPLGIAHHHSGLTTEERALIEGAFREKVLCVLCCTSTLAAGVNLPASRVIFKTPYVGREFLTKSKYTQMAGRAGRAGFDSHGESYLILGQRNAEDKRGLELMKAPLENVGSYLLAQEETTSKYFTN
jgi:POLQ-like helicase